MQLSMLVSFIIPTFNRGYILPKAIDSIRAQTSSDWELIVVDDGSTDKTETLVKGYNDDRIKYIFQANRGPSAARNTAFKHVKGEWVAYLDSDNTIAPTYVVAMVKAIEQDPKALYALPKGTRRLELYKNGHLIKSIDDSKDFPDELTVKDVFLRKIHLDVNGLMHSRKLIDEGFHWDEDLSRMEDWHFFMTIAEKYPTNFLYVKKVLSHYVQRFGGDGLVSNTSYKEWAEAFEYIYHKHQNDTLLDGQTWYPRKVNEYNQLDEDFQNGKAPVVYERYFI